MMMGMEVLNPGHGETVMHYKKKILFFNCVMLYYAYFRDVALDITGHVYLHRCHLAW